MAKKFGKLMLFSALAGAVAAGTYYCLRNKNGASMEDADDFDDCDGFDKDLEDEDFSTDSTNSKSRPHMPIDIDNAKEKIGEKVIETLDKTKEKIEHFNVSDKIDRAKEFIGEMTAPATEPAYTQMDISSAPSEPSISETDSTNENTDEPLKDETTTASISSTYADSITSENSTEEFFDDSQNN